MTFLNNENSITVFLNSVEFLRNSGVAKQTALQGHIKTHSIMILSKELSMEEQKMIDLNSICALGLLAVMREEPISMRNSILTGNMYYRELMETENEQRFMDVVRMRRSTFFMLLKALKKNGLANTKLICAGEKLMMYIYIFCVEIQIEVLLNAGNTVAKQFQE